MKSTLLGRDSIKRENRINGGQDRREGNIVSLIQHDYYGSHLQNYTDLAYIELLGPFPIFMISWGYSLSSDIARSKGMHIFVALWA